MNIVHEKDSECGQGKHEEVCGVLEALILWRGENKYFCHLPLFDFIFTHHNL